MVADGESDRDRRAQYIGVGCFAAFAGAVSGGMIFVMVAKVAGMATKCVPVQGLPACNWEVFWFVGIVLGAVSLPVLVLRRLRAKASKPGSERS